MVSFPATVWDGDSLNRDSDDAPRKAPDWRDWIRMIGEMAATMHALKGIDPNTLHTVGAVTSKTGLSIVETGTGAVHKTVFTFAEMQMASVPGSTQNSDGDWGTQTLYTFPEGHIAVLGTHAQFPLGKLEAVTGGGTGFADDADFEIGIGSVASAQWTGWGLNNSTQEDIVTALDVDLTSKTSNAIESAASATPVLLDGSGGAKILNLNFRGLAEADHGGVADVLLVSGIFTVLWTNLGDNG